jgi:hypothetical protein
MRLMILNRRRLSFRIEMRRHPPDHLNCPHTMRNRHDGVTIDPLSRGPLPPLAVNGPSRIDKHTIQIKQNGRTRKYRHLLI